jgi:hypothetical protein
MSEEMLMRRFVASVKLGCASAGTANDLLTRLADKRPELATAAGQMLEQVHAAHERLHCLCAPENQEFYSWVALEAAARVHAGTIVEGVRDAALLLGSTRGEA